MLQRDVSVLMIQIEGCNVPDEELVNMVLDELYIQKDDSAQDDSEKSQCHGRYGDVGPIGVTLREGYRRQ